MTGSRSVGQTSSGGPHRLAALVGCIVVIASIRSGRSQQLQSIGPDAMQAVLTYSGCPPGTIAMWDEPFTGSVGADAQSNLAVTDCGPGGTPLAHGCASKPPGAGSQPITFTVDPVDASKTYVFGTLGFIGQPCTFNIAIADAGTATNLQDTIPFSFGLDYEIIATYKPVARSAKFTFDLTAAAAADHLQARALTHAYAPGDHFFSNAQLGAQQTIPAGSARPQLAIDGTVTGQPAANEMWVKLVDVPDTASYVPAADAHDGDNRDPAPAFLRSADGSQQASTGTALKTAWDAAKRVRVILEVSDHVAGDNYRVIASFSPPDATGSFPCEATGASSPCAASPVVTVWKRVYIDQYAMFREGAFLAASVAAGDRQIILRSDESGRVPRFAGGQTVRLLAGSPRQYSEDVVIDPNPLDARGNPLPIVENRPDGTLLVRLKTPVMNAYTGAAIASNSSLYGADAVGIPGHYFIPDATALVPFYADMSVDAVVGPSVRDFPAAEPNTSMVLNTRARSLTPMARPVLAARFVRSHNDNEFHVIGAGNDLVVFTSAPTNCHMNLGDTIGGSVNNFSYIYVGNIEEAVQGPVRPCLFPIPALVGRNAVSLNQAAVVHEVTHQFQVNDNTPGRTGGHCAEGGLVPPARPRDLCLMNHGWPANVVNTDQIDLPRLSFHWLSRGSDSEYTEIRAHNEPATQ